MSTDKKPSRLDGTEDMLASKASVRKDVSVQVRQPVPAPFWGLRFKNDRPDFAYKKTQKQHLADFIKLFEKMPELAARIETDRLLESDLFFVNYFLTNYFGQPDFRFFRIKD